MANSLFRRLGTLRRWRTFGRNADGATAVEFAIVVIPFFALLGTIIETGLIFLSNQALEQAASKAGRAVMVGEIARMSGTPADKENAFKTKLCAEAAWFINCADILYDVRPYSSFSAVDLSKPVSGGTFNATGLPRFNPGGAGQIVVVRAYYKRPIFADRLGANMGYLTGGYYLSVATSVFKSES